jgi:hypothetical protein
MPAPSEASAAFLVIVTFLVAALALLVVGAYYTACILAGLAPPALWKLGLTVLATTVAANIGAIALIWWRTQ